MSISSLVQLRYTFLCYLLLLSTAACFSGKKETSQVKSSQKQKKVESLCDVYDAQNSQVKVYWTAFKTPQKLGVAGHFTKVDIESTSSSTFESFLKSLQLQIDAKSASTDHPDRDKTLFETFFSKMMPSQIIKASVKSVTPSKGEMEVMLLFNKVSKIEVFHYQYDPKNKLLKANSTIELGSYGMSGALAELNKACFELHQGKTWSDVNIGLELKLSKCHKF